jgi:hypothetical protein
MTSTYPKSLEPLGQAEAAGVSTRSMVPLILSIGGNWGRRVGFGPATERMDNANPTNRRQSGSLRGFWSLFITQFQGAFSDNMFKFLAIFFVMYAGY